MTLTFGSVLGDGDAIIDLDRLIETRLLIQANSGGGKSYAIRKLVEEMFGHVQIIILDIEGEFATLRERFDFILAGENGDIQASIRTAEVLARKLLELKVSAIVDLYELKQQERKHFVRLFLDSMLNAPKELWHPCVVVIDEAHVYCPQVGDSEAAGSVNDLMTRGRKRGFCGVLATQRLSKLHKDSAAEANNKLIGRCGLDDDMKRGAFELGFMTKAETLSLRDLEPGEFFAFGPALSKSVEKVKVGEVKTSHPKIGARVGASVIPPTQTVKALLAKLTDIPQVAEKQRNDVESLQTRNRELEVENRRLRLNSQSIDPSKVKEIQDTAFANGVASATRQAGVTIKALEKERDVLRSVISDINQRSSKALGVPPRKPEPLPPVQAPGGTVPTPKHHDSIVQKQPVVDGEAKPLRDGAMRMLKAAAQFHPTPISRNQMATLSGFSVGGGTFGTYFAELKRNGWIIERGDDVEITYEGLANAGVIESLPTDPQALIDLWAGKFRDGAAKMLRAIAERYPASITREELGEVTSFTPSGGTFGTYVSELRRNGLIEIQGDDIKASPTLFLEAA